MSGPISCLATYIGRQDMYIYSSVMGPVLARYDSCQPVGAGVGSLHRAKLGAYTHRWLAGHIMVLIAAEMLAGSARHSSRPCCSSRSFNARTSVSDSVRRPVKAVARIVRRPAWTAQATKGCGTTVEPRIVIATTHARNGWGCGAAVTTDITAPPVRTSIAWCVGTSPAEDGTVTWRGTSIISVWKSITN